MARRVTAARRYAEAAFETGRADAPPAVSLVLLMVRRGRPGAIEPMITRFGELLRRERGIALAQIRSALPLDDGQRAEISARLRTLTGSKIEMDEQVDPELI